MARLARGGVSGEQLAQGPFYYPPAPQGGVEATPSSPVGGHEAQVDRRRNRAGGGEQGVGQLKERVGSTLEAPVERVSKGAQIVEGLRYGVHNDPSCSQCSPMSTADNDPWPLGLKHKLRGLHNAPVLAARIPATHTYDSRGGYSLLLTIIYGLLLISGICLLSVGGLEVVERLVPAERRQQHNDVAGFIYAALGVIYAVLLALVVIAVFEEFQAANETVEQEANAVAEIFWLGHPLPEPEGTHIQELCRSYAEEVVHKEWPLMEQGQAPLMTQTQATPV